MPRRAAVPAPVVTLFALATLANATVVTSTSCSTNLGTINGTSSCYLAGSGGTVAGSVDGYASASASGQYTVSGNTLSVTATVLATAFPTFTNPSLHTIDTGAGATVNITASFVVSGTGPAFVELTHQPQFSIGEEFYDDDGATLNVQFGNYETFACSSNTFTVTPCNTGAPFSPSLVAIPTNVPITLTFTEQAGAAGDLSGAGGAGATANVQFSFLGANGITPLAVTETPEPATRQMLLTGCAALLLSLRAFRRP